MRPGRVIEVVLFALLGAVFGLLAGAIAFVWLALSLMTLERFGVSIARDLWSTLALFNTVIGGLVALLLMFLFARSMVRHRDPIKGLIADASQLRRSRGAK